MSGPRITPVGRRTRETKEWSAVTLSARNHRSRQREIAEILGRHGLGFFVGVAGLDRFVPFHRGLFGHARRDTPYTRPEHVRIAFEELGTTFIKFGQILSTRADLLPPPYQAELARLQDQAPPVPVELVRAVVSGELGRPIEELFARFEPDPLAVGSIGQAHAAILADGTEVVVKVRRPGVIEQVEEDLRILADLARSADRRWEAASQFDLPGLVSEFGRTLRSELDYVAERQNAERFAAMFTGDPTVHIPRVFSDRSTTAVLTLERMHGLKISDQTGLDRVGIDRRLLARRATDALLKMVFEERFFHADPHPGNFFIGTDGTIGLIDFGMVGVIDERTRDQLARFLVALSSQDASQLVDAFLDLGVGGRGATRDALERDLARLMMDVYGRPLGEIRLGPVIAEAQAIARNHQLRFPTNLALLLKTLAMAEALATDLDPEFRMSEALEPYARQLLIQQHSPAAWARSLARAGIEASQLGVELPQHLRRLLADLERGAIEVSVRPTGLEPALSRLERLANRIVVGVIIAAFINGLAVLMSVFHPPGGGQLWTGIMFSGGFVIAGVLGLSLIVSILWGRRGAH